jgi:tetratricopeptide (TPR) repeat protein
VPRLATITIFGVLAATPAAAQNARYPRPVVVPAVKLSDRVKPLVPKQPAARPPIDASIALSIEGITRTPRAEQEHILVELIAQTPDTEVEEKADYYFRLGQLYAAQQYYWRSKALDPNAKPADVQTASNKAKDALLKAVKTFKALVDNDAFRSYPKLDTALFEYAYTLQSGQYMKEARAVYDKLLKNFPASKYVPQAHLAFAEYYFATHQLADAEARYQQVLKFPLSTSYWFATYRLGLVKRENGNYPDALETLFKVVQQARTTPSLEPLGREAMAELVRTYVAIGKPDKAFAAFQRIDAKTALDSLEGLGELYAANGAYDKALTVYRQIAAVEPKTGRGCRARYQIAHVLVSIATAPAADKVAEIEALARTAKTVDAADADAPECNVNAEAMAGEMARAFHAEAAKTRDPRTVDFAERLYRAALDVSPDVQTEQLLAELLWFRADVEPDATARNKQWERAADAFASIATKDAARAAVLAWRNALDVDTPELLAGEIDLAKARAATATRQPITARDAKLLAAFDAYAQLATDADDQLVTAIMLRRYHHDDNSAAILTSFLEHHRDHPSAELAANLLLEALVYLRRYDDVLATADKLAADASFMAGKPRLKKSIEFLRSRSLRNP